MKLKAPAQGWHYRTIASSDPNRTETIYNAATAPDPVALIAAASDSDNFN
jgi:hypothetical protein